MKSKKKHIIPLLIIIIGFVSLCVILPLTIGIDDIQGDGSEVANSKPKIVFDALQYEVKDGKNISEKKLIKQLGKPKKIDKWNYTSANGNKYKIRTLIYEDREYSFNNDNLQRITLYDEFKYNDKKDFLSMFNLKANYNTVIKDTNSYYRAYNCGVNDIWIEYEDGLITLTKISYGDVFDK